MRHSVKNLKYPVLLWSVNLLVTAFAVWLSLSYLPKGPHPQISIDGSVLRGMTQWDGQWYVNIARDGYFSLESTAFFPGFPLMIRMLAQVLPGYYNYELAALLIANLSFLGALIVLWDFYDGEHCRDQVVKMMILLIVMPGSFFFTMGYTEPLTLFLTVAVFLALKRDAWYKAVVLVCLAGCVKQLGVLLGLVLLYHLFTRRAEYNSRMLVFRLFSLVWVPFGLFLFMWHTYAVFDDAFAFLHAQQYWYREPVIPVVNVVLSLGKLLVKRYTFEFSLMRLVNGLTTLAYVYAGVKMFRRDNDTLGTEKKIYYFSTLLLSISSAPGGDTVPFGRHMSTLFPGTEVLSEGVQGRIGYLILGMLYLVKMLLVMMYCNGYNIT